MALVKTHDMSDFSVYLLDSFYTCFLLEQLALARLANSPAMVNRFLILFIPQSRCRLFRKTAHKNKRLKDSK